jgi:hypothetical protein
VKRILCCTWTFSVYRNNWFAFVLMTCMWYFIVVSV